MKIKIIFLYIVLSLGITLGNAHSSDTKTNELGAILYGVLERAATGCKAVGTKNPSSVSTWLEAVPPYRDGEIKRDQLYKASTGQINSIIDTYAENKSNEAQVAMIELLISANKASITSLNDSTSGRITLRKELLSKLQKAIDYNSKESKLITDSLFELNDSLVPKAISIAKSACERKINDKKSPVKYCEIAQSKYSSLIQSKLKEIYDLLFKEEIPSTTLNEKLISILKELKN